MELLVPIALSGIAVQFYVSSYEGFFKRAEEVGYGVDVFTECQWEWPMIASVLYLLMVFGGKALTDAENYRPWSIAPYMFWYNVYQCVINLVTVVAMIYEVYQNPHFISPWGNFPQAGKAGVEISFWVWLHYNNKYVELLDTAFMIVRKKNDQASFLHCYHHVLLIWSWFLVVQVGAGGDSYFGACVNSFIHVIMYAYYTVALCGIDVPKWVKQIVTKCQMTQFCVCLAHAIFVAYTGNCPPILPAMQAFVMVNMLVLFSNFSKKAYGKNVEVKAAQEDVVGAKKKMTSPSIRPAPSVDDLLVSCPARLDS
jgi:elongation of very long chain fatty acids protein 4